MRYHEENATEPKFNNGQSREVLIEDDDTLSGQVADIEVREYLRIIAIRQGNIQTLLSAILEQNRKGMKIKTELDIDIVDVPPLDPA